MIEEILNAIAWADTWLTEPGASRAIAAGFLTSWSVTQVIKKLVTRRFCETKDDRKRWNMAAAFLLGAIPTLILWPNFTAMAGFSALVVGGAAPGAYEILDRVLASRWKFWRIHVTASGGGSK